MAKKILFNIVIFFFFRKIPKPQLSFCKRISLYDFDEIRAMWHTVISKCSNYDYVLGIFTELVALLLFFKTKTKTLLPYTTFDMMHFINRSANCFRTPKVLGVNTISIQEDKLLEQIYTIPTVTTNLHFVIK